MRSLASVYATQGEYARAEALFSRALEVCRRALGPEHPATLATLSEIASMYQQQGKYALAEANAAQVLAGRRAPGSGVRSGEAARRPGRNPGPLSTGARPRVDCQTLSGVAQARESGRVGQAGADAIICWSFWSLEGNLT
jgi:tetratricopeptide (TPR) repeat protein